MADKKRAGIELKLIDAKQSRPADGVARLGVDSQILGDRPSRHGSSRPPAADSSTLSLRTFSQSGPVRRPHDGQVGDSRASAHTGGHTGGPPAANQHTLRGATTPARSNAPLPLRFFAQSGPVRLAPGVPLSASIPTKPAETMQPTGPMNRAKKKSEIMEEFKTEWAPQLLDIMLEREHDARLGSQCARCQIPGANARFKCFECFQLPPLCDECMKTAHTHAPFHEIHSWGNGFFTRVPLSALGFVINIGHDGAPCPRLSQRAAISLTVVHEGGIHEIKVARCSCGDHGTRGYDAMSLWRCGLFPASFVQPRTAMTSGVLRNFHLLTLTTKVTSAGFTSFLRRRTDYWSKESSKERSREFLNAFRMFCFLRNLKRHAQRPPSLGRELSPGCLAVFCPACPQPNINMTPGWEDRPQSLQYLDARFSTRDGNFSLGQKSKRMDHDDLPLSMNAMYFVHSMKYARLMQIEMDDLIPLGCNNFKALDYRGIKSGIVSHICRHDFFEANGTADLPKGERFRVVDYAMISSHNAYRVLKMFVEVYDVACKWWPNFFKRLRESPELQQDFPGLLDRWPLIMTAVGKYHVPNHTDDCRRVRDIHLIPGVGQLDGDNPERVWAVEGKIGASIQEMGSGSREDTMNEHFSDWNMRKFIELPVQLVIKMRTARKERDAQHAYLRDLEGSLPSDVLQQWKAEEEKWLVLIVRNDVPASLQSPYQMSKEKAPTERQVFLALRSDEDVVTLDNAVGSGKSVVDLLKVGMSIEEQQLKLRRMRTAQTSDALANDIAELDSEIRRRLRAWRSWQTSTFATLLQRPLVTHEEDDSAAEDAMEIAMPSTLADDALAKLPQFQQLLNLEYQMRETKANEAIRHLRRFIALKSVLHHRRRMVTGTISSTKSYNSIKRATDSINKWRDIYDHSYSKLTAIGLSMDSNLQPLCDADIGDLDMRGAHLGYSRDRVSWIWGKVAGDAVDENDLDSWADEAQKVERNLAAARAARWTEEVSLLEEEMRRTLRFYCFQVKTWVARQGARKGNACERGFDAYCLRQASYFLACLLRARRSFGAWIPEADVKAASELEELTDWANDVSAANDNPGSHA